MLSRRRTSRRVAFLLAASLGVPAGAVALLSPRPSIAAEPDEEFREGLKAFGQGRFEDAERHFGTVLKSKPSDEQARLYRDEAGYQFWVEVLAKGGNLATLAKRLLYSAEKGALKERQDPEKIQAALQGLWSDDFMKQTEATEELVAKHGHYVVPFLVETLGDKRDDDRRVRAITLLSRLGEEGTLALLQVLKAEEPLARLNACVVLGNVRDARAVPSLKRVAEKDADAHVKREAEEALKKLGSPAGGTGEWYAKVADKFYREHPLVMVNRYKEWAVWKLKDGKLKGDDSLRFVWAMKVARDLSYEGLGLNPADAQLWNILLCSYASEIARVDESLVISQQRKDKGGEIDDAEVEKLKKAKGELKKAETVLALGGADRLLGALRKALEDQEANVAVKIIETLRGLNLDPNLLPGGGAASIEPKKTAPDEPGGQPTATSEPPASGGGSGEDVRRPKPKPEGGGEPAKSEPAKSEPAKSEPASGGGEPAKSEPAKSEPAKSEPAKSEPKADEPAKPKPRRVSQLPPKPAVLDGTRESQVSKFAGKGPQLFAAVEPAGGGGEAGASICAALGYGDKRVRYAAAIALAHLNPPKTFANSDKVMLNLGDALAETGQRVILVVERDTDTRNRIVGLLRELGYMTFGVESGNEGLVRAKSFPGEDLIVVSSELNPQGSGADPVEFQFIDSLREDYRTKTIPVMVLSPRNREKQMQELVDDKRAVDVITPDVDKAVLSDKVKKVFGTPEHQQDEKARNDKVSKDAAAAIASIRGATNFDLGVTSKPLAGCIGRADEGVKIAAMKAIAAVGPKAKADCLDPLIQVFKAGESSVDVREAAANAIGECLKGSSLDKSADVFKTLKAALNDPEERIWRAAGFALGKAQLTGDAAREVLEEQRIE